MTDRKILTDLINQIECDYPVTKWKHNGYHIWPLLRIRLYMLVVKQAENSQSDNYEINTFWKKIKNFALAWIELHKLNNNIESIYCGASSYRVDYQGKRYNRYFDPLMDSELAPNLLVERNSSAKTNYYKPERVLLTSDLLKFSQLFFKAGDFLGRENEYARKLDSILKSTGFVIKDFVPLATRHITNIDRALFFFEKLLRKTMPERVYELCYYSTSLLGLNIAADKLGITTIDVQHGPQGKNHLAYDSWKNVPKEGYEALPDEFYTWDEFSAINIRKWADAIQKHSANCTGNPWVEGWKRGEFSSSNYQYPEMIVLYTLQPIENPLEGYILDTIKKTSDKWNWWLRIHPRQKGELKDLEKKLREHGLLEKVNIKDASELLLPEILVNTKVHLTKFSGCAIEAFNFGTPTIILDKRGEDIFEDYFEYGIMSNYTGKDTGQLIQKINSYIKK